MEAFVLVDVVPGEVDALLAKAAANPLVLERHHVHYGHFDVLLKISAPSHHDITAFVVQLKFQHGVELIREVAAEEVPAILASDEPTA